MTELRVERVAAKAHVCRGVLLDRPELPGVNRLPIARDTKSPGIITADPVKAMAKNQGLEEIGKGDCVVLCTAPGDLWKNSTWKELPADEKAKRRAIFTPGEPGFGRSASEDLASRKIEFWVALAEPTMFDPRGRSMARRCPATPSCGRDAAASGTWRLSNSSRSSSRASPSSCSSGPRSSSRVPPARPAIQCRSGDAGRRCGERAARSPQLVTFGKPLGRR